MERRTMAGWHKDLNTYLQYQPNLEFRFYSPNSRVRRNLKHILVYSFCPFIFSQSKHSKVTIKLRFIVFIFITQRRITLVKIGQDVDQSTCVLCDVAVDWLWLLKEVAMTKIWVSMVAMLQRWHSRERRLKINLFLYLK